VERRWDDLVLQRKRRWNDQVLQCKKKMERPGASVEKKAWCFRGKGDGMTRCCSFKRRWNDQVLQFKKKME